VIEAGHPPTMSYMSSSLAAFPLLFDVRKAITKHPQIYHKWVVYNPSKYDWFTSALLILIWQTPRTGGPTQRLPRAPQVPAGLPSWYIVQYIVWYIISYAAPKTNPIFGSFAIMIHHDWSEFVMTILRPERCMWCLGGSGLPDSFPEGCCSLDTVIQWKAVHRYIQYTCIYVCKIVYIYIYIHCVMYIS
jgi:hypothetical protein